MFIPILIMFILAISGILVFINLVIPMMNPRYEPWWLFKSAKVKDAEIVADAKNHVREADDLLGTVESRAKQKLKNAVNDLSVAGKTKEELLANLNSNKSKEKE